MVRATLISMRMPSEPTKETAPRSTATCRPADPAAVSCPNPGADATVFGLTAITGDLPGDISSAYGYGGGNLKAGVTCGIRLEADAIKNTAGVESSVTYARWFPQGTLTLAKPGEFGTSAKVGVTQYSFTPVRVTTDLGGDAIDGASADGDFYFDGEI